MSEPKRTEPPEGGLMNKNFRYVKHEATDVAATFARIRKQQKAEQAALANVCPLKKPRVA